jgi:RHS repeat-associated protein
MSVAMAPPVLAAEPAAPAPEPIGPSVASLSRTAAPTEVASLRTAYSNTYNNHDGTYTASVSSSLVNYQPSVGAAWQPIDLTLAPVSGSTTGRVRASKTPAPVEVGAPDDAAGFASVDTGSGRITLSLAPGAKPGRAGSKPTTSGDRADVSGLLPGVDLRVIANPDGFRLFLTLASRPASSSFTFALDSGSLTPMLEINGSISFLNKNGDIVASMPRPYAGDSTPNDQLGGGVFTDKVSYALEKSGSQYLLTVNVAPSFLDAATYPVYVDPSIVVTGPGPTYNTFVSHQYPGSNYNGYNNGTYYEMWLGTDPTNSNNYNYALVKFALPSAITGATIDSATLGVYPYWQYQHSGGVTTWLDRITSNWDVHTVTWNNQPTSTNILQGNTNQGYYSAFLVTSLVQSWVSGASSNYGFMLRQANGDGRQWKRLIASGQGAGYIPKLDITYHVPVVTLLSPVGGGWTGSRVLSWDYAEVSGLGQSKFSLVLATNSSFTSPILSTGVVSSVSKSYAIPTTTALTDGTTYYWEVQASNGTAWSAWASGSFKWDSSAPTWTGFTAPTARIDQSGTSYTFAWTAAGGGSTIASYGVQLQSAPLSATANLCTGNWANAGAPVVTATSYAVSGMVARTCYRVGVTARDSAGNVNAVSYSSPVLIDTSAPAPPVVINDTTPLTSSYASNYTIYFRPSGPRTITLTSTGTDGDSGIASSTFSALSSPTGWTYTPGTLTGNNVSKTLTWSASSTVTTSLTVKTTNNAGTISAATTITFVPVTGATADFTTPDEGTTTVTTLSSDYSIAWVETPGLTGITARSLQRQAQPIGSDGLCSGGSWADDGTAVTSTSPVSVPAGSLPPDKCYRWNLTLTDSTGSTTFTSGSLVVDGTAPTATIAYPEAGRPISGSVTVSGVASDAHMASYVLDYGAGSAPTSWTTIASSAVAVPTSGPLGLWASGSLTGPYTLRLTVTDYAGNTTATTNLVYLDNTARGDESYYTKVPFDLGGGWDLGVNVATGEAGLARDLFAIPSYGPAQSLSLAYNSADTGTAGQFGTGWSSNLTQYLTTESGFVVWHRADGGRVAFGQIGGARTALAGHYEKLTAISGGYKITYTDQSSLTFDDSGRLTAIGDRFGVSLALSWSASSATATDASGRATTLTIDSANHRITGATDSAGRQWGFAYTGANLTGITDPAGKVTTLAYTGSNQLTSVSRQRTPAGGSAQAVVWSLGYTSGLVTSVTDPIGATATPAASSTFAYGLGTTTVRTLRDSSNNGAPIFNASTYAFDSHGWVFYALDPVGWASTAVFDGNGNVIISNRQITSSTWATTSAQYDGSGNQTQVTDPLGYVTRRTFNVTNDLLTETRAYGTAIALTTAYVYDGSGHLCRKVVNPTVDPNTITCTGSLGGNSDQNVDTQYTYTANNQLASETDPLGVKTVYGYDSLGNQTSVTRNYVAGQADDSTSVTTTYTYDLGTRDGKAGLPATETVPITTVTPALSRTTTYAYDVMGHALSQSQPADSWTPAERIEYAYDEFGAKVSETRKAGDPLTVMTSTTTVYDARGRATSVTTTTPTATTSTTTVYDAAGDAPIVTNNDGSNTTRKYDALGRVVSEQANSVNATTHAYDGLGDETTTVSPAPAMTTTTTTRVFDANGHATSVTVDASGTPATTTHVYDALGRETSSTDPAGLVTTTIHDGADRVFHVQVGDALTVKEYDKAGRIVRVTAPVSQTSTVTATAYDPLGRVCRSVSNATIDIRGLADPCRTPIARTETTNLDTQTYHNAAGDSIATVRLAVDDAKDVVTRTMFGIRGDAYETIANCTDSGRTPSPAPASCVGGGTHDGATNIVTTNSFTAGGSILTSTQVAGGVTTVSTYDGAGRVLYSIVDPGSSPHAALRTDYAYDSAGRQIATRSPALVVTVTVYDSQGRTTATIANCSDANPGALPGSNWASCTGAGTHDGTWNQVTSYGYDDAGHKVRQTAPSGTVTAYAYDAKGQEILQVTNYVAGYAGADPTVNVTTNYYYDANGRRIAAATPTSTGSYTITRDFFDSNGRLTKEVLNCTSSGTTPDANPAACTGLGTANAQTNITTTYGYDTAGHRIWMTAPSPTNGAGSTATVTTRYAYDTNGRLCRVLENASVDLQTLADPCSTVVSGTATSDVSTTYQYYSTGLLWRQNTAAGQTTYEYDALGHVLSQTDANGYTTAWTYDPAGSKTAQIDSDTSPAPTVSYAYDSAERPCRRVAGADLSAYSDPCTHAVTGVTVDTRYTYAYNADGTFTVSVTDALNSRTITAILDQLGRPTSVSGDATGDPATTYGYALTGQTRTDPSGTYTIALDAYGRQSTLTDPISHPSGLPFVWTYAPSGAVATASDPTANKTTYTYDPLGRLTASSTTGSSGCTNCAVYAYTYNRASSKLTQVSTISGATGNGTTTYAYDPLGRLVTYTPPAALQAGVYTWNGQPDRASIKIGTGATVTTTFDPASRPTVDTGGGTYTSDHEGRLTGFPGKILIYDALGRLTQVKASDGTLLASYTYDALDRLRTVSESGVTTRFRYVGASTAVAQVIDNSSGSVISNHATDLAGIELYDFTPGGASQAYLGRNGHNDVTWTASSTGAVSATAAYDPFGGLAASTGSVPNSRWQGSWQDTVTGLYYVIARWYAPTLGRFTSNDPLWGDTAKPQSRDMYAYGAGDAVDGTDPDGRRFLYDGGGEDRRIIVDPPKQCGFMGTAISGGSGLFGSLASRTACRARGVGDAAFVRDVIKAPLVKGVIKAPLVGAVTDAGLVLQALTDISLRRYDEILDYMYDEMHRNSGDFSFVGRWQDPLTTCGLGTIFNPGCPLSVQVANNIMLYAWAWKVRPDGDWDHKKHLNAKYPGWSQWTAIREAPSTALLYFDVWSNIHYGYVGRAHGIPDSVLMVGQQAVAVVLGNSDAGDDYTVQLGMDLWRDRGYGMTKKDLHNLIISHLYDLRDKNKVRGV